MIHIVLLLCLPLEVLCGPRLDVVENGATVAPDYLRLEGLLHLTYKHPLTLEHLRGCPSPSAPEIRGGVIFGIFGIWKGYPQASHRD